MIRISKIDDILSVFKDCTVFFIGIDDETSAFVDLFNYYKIDIKAIFDAKPNEDGIYRGITVLSSNCLLEMVKNSENVLLQSSSDLIKPNLQEQLKAKGIIKELVSYKEALDMLWLLRILENIKKSPMYYNDVSKISKILKDQHYQRFISLISADFKNDNLILLTPNKLGEIELSSTLKKHNIKYLNMLSMSTSFDKEFVSHKNSKVKILLCLVEPIIQNIINLYSLLVKSKYEPEWSSSLAEENVFNNGGDASKLLEIYDKHYGTSEFNLSREYYSTYSIATMIKGFNENIIDLLQHPFDKEKGYSIVAEGNIEVFVFQYEKINILAKEISTWVGKEKFDKWESRFTFNNNWLASSFNNALQEIEFSREYFDRMYSDSYINHFYCEDDIARFKARWEKHIKD